MREQAALDEYQASVITNLQVIAEELHAIRRLLEKQGLPVAPPIAVENTGKKGPTHIFNCPHCHRVTVVNNEEGPRASYLVDGTPSIHCPECGYLLTASTSMF